MLFTRSLLASAASATTSKAAVSSKTPTTVQLFYDIISPYTYVQFELLTRQKAHWRSMSLQFTPVAIGPLMTGAGNAPPMFVPAKAVYMMRDLARLTAFHKIPFRMRSDFPQFALQLGSLRSQRFLLAFENELLSSSSSSSSSSNSEADEQYETLIRRLFRAFFSPDEASADISDLGTIEKIVLAGGGVDGQLVARALEASSSAEVRAKLKANTEAAGAAGGFGLPITAVHLPAGSGADPAVHSIWGSDRMHIVGHLLGESQPPIL